MRWCSKLYHFMRLFVLFLSITSLSVICIGLYLETRQFEELIIIAVKTNDPSHIKYIGTLKSASDPANQSFLSDVIIHFQNFIQ